ALARRLNRLDEHDVAAHGRPCEPGRHPHLGLPSRDLALDLGLAGELLEVLRGDLDVRRPSLDHLESGLAEDALDFPLELAHPGFAGVFPDQPLQRPVRDARPLALESRLLPLARPEAAPGAAALLGGRLPG